MDLGVNKCNILLQDKHRRDRNAVSSRVSQNKPLSRMSIREPEVSVNSRSNSSLNDLNTDDSIIVNDAVLRLGPNIWKKPNSRSSHRNKAREDKHPGK